jgi:hypothetical protein
LLWEEGSLHRIVQSDEKFRNPQQEIIMKKTLTLALLAFAFVSPLSFPTEASALGMPASILQSDSDLVQVYVARRGGVAVGPRGGFAARRTTVVGRPGWNGGGVRRTTVVRPGWNGGGVRWARPGWYRWPAGGAIAAGAALGFVAAGAAVAYAGAAPAPGMCWYYTDPSRTQGFWDACP